MVQLPYIDAGKIEELHSYLPLIAELETAFGQKKITYPLRQHYSYGENNTLLTMPCWEDGRDIGIKLVTVTPANQTKKLPSIQGVVVYFDATTGSPLALLDAAALTRKRTAAASALASKYLSRVDSNSLLLLGTGALAPEMILAHTVVRPIEQVYVWGRTYAKAQQIEKLFSQESFQIEAIPEYDQLAPQVSIISTATMSSDPLLRGQHLSSGQHLDLVGSYKPDMREVNDEVISQVQIFVDNRLGATKESGDLFIPLQTGIITSNAICGELADLCSGASSGRSSSTTITAFKSVGLALEDLVAARYYYQRYLATES